MAISQNLIIMYEHRKQDDVWRHAQDVAVIVDRPHGLEVHTLTRLVVSAHKYIR